MKNAAFGKTISIFLSKPTFSMPYVENCKFYKNCMLNKWFFCIRILFCFHWGEMCLQRYSMGQRWNCDTCNNDNIITLQTCIKYLNYLQILNKVIKYSVSSTTNKIKEINSVYWIIVLKNLQKGNSPCSWKIHVKGNRRFNQKTIKLPINILSIVVAYHSRGFFKYSWLK